MPARPSLTRRIVAEALGTALLLATVVGSGIMGERLAGGNVAVALLANTLATGAGLVALILDVRRRSRARTSTRWSRSPTRGRAGCHGATCRLRVAQIVGAFAGVAARTSCSSVPAVLRVAPRASGARSCSARSSPRSGCSAVIWGCAPARARGPVRRRRVHHGGVLVHRVDLVREPRRHAGARGDRHVRRHPRRPTRRLRRRPARRRRPRHAALSLGSSPPSRPSPRAWPVGFRAEETP